MHGPTTEITLTAALVRLRMSWAQGYRAVLTGRLAGRQMPNGRWLVTLASVEAAERERKNDPVAA
jgi:hypothetical protein